MQLSTVHRSDRTNTPTNPTRALYRFNPNPALQGPEHMHRSSHNPALQWPEHMYRFNPNPALHWPEHMYRFNPNPALQGPGHMHQQWNVQIRPSPILGYFSKMGWPLHQLGVEPPTPRQFHPRDTDGRVTPTVALLIGFRPRSWLRLRYSGFALVLRPRIGLRPQFSALWIVQIRPLAPFWGTFPEGIQFSPWWHWRSGIPPQLVTLLLGLRPRLGLRYSDFALAFRPRFRLRPQFSGASCALDSGFALRFYFLLHLTTTITFDR